MTDFAFRTSHKIKIFIITLAFSLASLTAAAQPDNGDSLNQLKTMSLESLMQVTVYSASQKSQPLSDVASAIYVITHEDIRRSGARTLPDLLRGVPGLHVANIDGHTWAVSARGFNGVFANKLLVLIDGRSVYTPLYSGVYWDTLDTLLDDIERIEIIRGPGATIWGANAVNGVINIITRNAADTGSGYAAAGIGSTDRNAQGFRIGKSGKELAYRIYGKRLERDNFDYYDSQFNENYDNWQNRQAGFRMDWQPRHRTRLTLQGDIYSGKAKQLLTYDIVNLPLYYEEVRSRGGNLMTALEYRQSASSQWNARAYIDRFLRDDGYFDQSRSTADISISNQRDLGADHEIVWGGGYRYTADHLTTSNEDAFFIDPDAKVDHLFNLFIQDEWTLQEDRVKLISGSKIEHNDTTGYEIQPSLRLLWTPSGQTTFWASVSRAVRTPSRTETSLNAEIKIPDQTIDTPYGQSSFPAYVSLSPDRKGHAEKVVAYELGFRTEPNRNMSLDTALFFNDYDNLRFQTSEGYELSPTSITFPAEFNYQAEGYSYGIEFSFVWQALDRWKINATYSWLQLDFDAPDNSVDLFFEHLEDSTPEHQASLNSRLDLPYGLQFDTTLYYFSHFYDTPAHLRCDARIGWQANESLEISIKGENLFDESYREYAPNFGVISSQVPRNWYAQVKYVF